MTVIQFNFYTSPRIISDKWRYNLFHNRFQVHKNISIVYINFRESLKTQQNVFRIKKIVYRNKIFIVGIIGHTASRTSGTM